MPAPSSSAAGGGDEGDPAVQVQRAAAAGQALGEVDRGHAPRPVRRCGTRGGGSIRGSAPGRTGRPLSAARAGAGPGGGRRRSIASRSCGVSCGGCEPGQSSTRPPQIGGARGDRRGGQREAVGHDERQPRVAARHLLLPADPHQAALAHGVGHRGGGLQGHPRPGHGDLPGDPAQHRQPQHRLVRRQQVQRRHRRAGLPGDLDQRGLQHVRTDEARTGHTLTCPGPVRRSEQADATHHPYADHTPAVRRQHADGAAHRCPLPRGARPGDDRSPSRAERRTSGHCAAP